LLLHALEATAIAIAIAVSTAEPGRRANIR
jgi:hypothetical protein